MGRWFDTAAHYPPIATVATPATETAPLSQESQLSQGAQDRTRIPDDMIDQRHAFEERAAIMEFDGRMSREEAERAAARDPGLLPQ